MNGLPPLNQALKAIEHALCQISQNPHLGYHAGLGSQTFSLLTEAYATLTTNSVEEVRKAFVPRLIGDKLTHTESIQELRSRLNDCLIEQSLGRGAASRESFFEHAKETLLKTAQ